MKRKTIEMLEKILEAKENRGYYDQECLLKAGFTDEEMREASNEPYNYVQSNGTYYYLTKESFEFLQRHHLLESTKSLKNLIEKMDEHTSKINKEMLKHTKTMKNLTWVILAFTIVNLILIGSQLYFSII